MEGDIGALSVGIVNYEVAKRAGTSPWARHYLEFQMYMRYIFGVLIVLLIFVILIFAWTHPSVFNKNKDADGKKKDPDTKK